MDFILNFFHINKGKKHCLMRFLKLYLIGKPKFEVKKGLILFWFLSKTFLGWSMLIQNWRPQKVLETWFKKNTNTTWMLSWNILQCLMGDSKGIRDTSSHEMLCPGRWEIFPACGGWFLFHTLVFFELWDLCILYPICLYSSWRIDLCKRVSIKITAFHLF